MGNSRLPVVLFALVVSLCVSTPAGADVLYQSAQKLVSGAVGNQLGGIGTDSSFFSGVNFQVTTPVHVTRIGGHFGNAIVAGNNEIFGAIMPVTSLTAAPQPADLSSNVLATTLITLPAADFTDDVGGNLSLNLSPGFYGVVFGAGKFGATGDTLAVTTLNNQQANTSGAVTYALRQSDGAFFTQAPGARYFVEGTVPEPASAATLAVAAALAAARRRRRRPARA